MRNPVLVLLAGVIGWAGVAGQPQPNEGAAPPGRVRFEDLPPAARLGLRADGVRLRTGVIPTVVIVPDKASYVAAIGAWNMAARSGDTKTVGARFPVLMDDQTWQAREDIARFVRAFEPRTIVRWSSPEAVRNWPVKVEEMRALVERTAYQTWGGATLEQARERWMALQFVPPGVVVAAPADPAWTAALALAAGHGQIFAWTLAMRDLSGSMSVEEARALNDSVTRACDAAGFSWKGLGDEIDAVTLCMSTPASVRTPPSDPRQFLATTDVIGRGVDSSADKRWAWAGQVPGSEARAAYAAMCALFLQPARAWLFDGYENKEPWSHWDASQAALLLEKAGLGALLNDNGNQAAEDWRNRASGMGLRANADAEREPGAGVDAGFVCVNTKGYPEFFDLLSGQCRAGDVPFLNVPAAVHFVHSFSAAPPADRTTIAGRFLEHGAFAYVGAVHEPGLQRFLPTPFMVQRMLASAAWGAGVRLDDGPAWKVAVFGDPLWTMGAPAPRIAAPLPLEGASDLQTLMTEALTQKNYAEAITLLAQQGRDADAARLVRALNTSDPQALTPEVALAGVMSVSRAPGAEASAGTGARLELLTRLCRLLEARYLQEPALRDIMWHAAYPSFASLTEEEVRALIAAIRPEQSERDAKDVARAAVRSLGVDRAGPILRELVPRLTDPNARKAVDDALRR